jgi:hypothetical protein
MPPTITTWSIAASPESASACLTGPTTRFSRSAVSSLSFERVSFSSRCLGWPSTAVMNGRLICVS